MAMVIDGTFVSQIEYASRKAEFFRRYCDERGVEVEARMRVYRVRPAMQTPQHLNALKAVNFLKPVTITDSTDKTQYITDLGPHPHRIILGSEPGIVYQPFSDGDHDPEELNFDVPATVQPSNICYEVQATDPSDEAPVKYVLHLRSEVPIENEEDTWQYLFTAADSRPSFDIMRLMSWEEFSALNLRSAPHRAMFSQQALNTAKRIETKLSWADAYYVKEALVTSMRLMLKSPPRSPHRLKHARSSSNIVQLPQLRSIHARQHSGI
ncbi:MAG: hypothetical protein Q9184_001968 [Pyrenodesmia sp. 2 TL-2023]